MERKKELKEQFKETEVEAGVFQIKNNRTDRILIGSAANLKILNGIKFMLDTNSYMPNRELQADWNEFGSDAFTFEILEKLQKKKQKKKFNEMEALLELEKKWVERLQPYGERGYNR
ncbi:LuxR family transcriptional regulator [Ammoniphilus oxalaticus]|uniref:LuxR family transcriptional regulator n=2 Tax=Ammoniphilus oxalaticus TaxID=66863 RepID=A0A419SNZ5_9BACL|nr:GIY-YIG nuclease family protein [Ammoniphilus oxalaticus]RKD25949.1 LuxR family transcriptional regulator [Ammoniphilus oxalaticus]